MAYPNVLTSNLTEEQSIDGVIESEAGLIQCMSKLFCGGEGDPGLVNFLSNIPRTEEIEGVEVVIPGNIEKRAELVKQILCSYGCKECSISEIIESLSNKIVVDKNIIGSSNACSCCKCK